MVTYGEVLTKNGNRVLHAIGQKEKLPKLSNNIEPIDLTSFDPLPTVGQFYNGSTFQDEPTDPVAWLSYRKSFTAPELISALNDEREWRPIRTKFAGMSLPTSSTSLVDTEFYWLVDRLLNRNSVPIGPAEDPDAYQSALDLLNSITFESEKLLSDSRREDFRHGIRPNMHIIEES